MNKIYKVVWSKAKHCYVVVSELAKNHTKGCGRRSLRRTAVSLGIVATLLGGFSGSAWADGSGTIQADDIGIITAGANITIVEERVTGSYQTPTTTITISATDTNTTYTAGNGIKISGGNNTISVDAGDGLCFDNSGKVAVKLDGTSTGGSHLSLDATNGLSVIVDGAVEDNNTGLVTGGTVFTALQSYATKAGAELSNATLTNATISSGSIATDVTVGTGEGAPKLGSIATAAGKVDGIETKTNKITISEGTATFTGNVTGNVTGDVTGNVTATTLKVGSTPTDVTTALTTAGAVAETNAGFVTGGVVYSALGDYVKTDATNITDLNNTQKQNWANALGNGTIDYDNTTNGNLVKGSTVRDALESLSTGQIAASGETRADKLVKGFTVYDYLNGTTLALGAHSTNIVIGSGNSIPNPVTGTGNTVVGYNNTIADSADETHVTSENLTVLGQNNKIIGVEDSIFIGKEIIGNGANHEVTNANGVIIIGNQAFAGNQYPSNSLDYSIGIGENVVVKGPYAIAIGSLADHSQQEEYATTASGNSAVAIGYSAKAEENESMAIGDSAKANAFGAIAIGYQANALTSSGTQLPIAIGGNAQATALNAIALGGGLNSGDGAVASAANTIAIGGGGTSSGNGASASEANAIAIGYNAKATKADSVALGSGAVTTRAAYATANYNAYLNEDGSKTPDTASTETKNAWRSTHGAVAVGNNATVTRQITGVAAGSADTDAVNVAQLKSATPMINDQHKYYNGSESAVSVVDAVNAVDKALGIIPSPTSGNYNYLSVYDATNEAGTFAKNLIALDRAIGSMSGFDNQHYAKNTGSVAANLTALDTQAYTNATNIGTLQTKTQHITATADATTMEGLLNVVPSGGTTGIAINGSDQTITGLSNKTWDASSIASGRAATEDQLKSATSSLSTTLTDTGLNFGANNVTAALTNKLGSTVNIMGTVAQDGHMYSAANVTTEIVQDTSGNTTITVKLDESPSFTNITATGNAILGSGTNTVTISGGAITATGNISGKDIIASGQLSSKTFVVDGVDVTTPLKIAGVVANGNTGAGFVTGATVYSEVRPTSDGTYVKTANTTAANLTALDTQVKTNTDSIAALGSSTTAAVGTIDADGNYIKKSDTNNVSQNLVALDTAIGDMSEFGSNNYAKSTASVATNIKSLDTQVKTNTDDITTLKNSISVKEDASGVKTTTIDGNLVIKEQDGTTKDVTTALTTEGEVAKQGDAGSEGYLKGETVYDYLNKGENGKEVKLAKESKQIAVGQGSVASGVESIAIGNETGGQRNEATGLQSIAIGFGNQVTGAHSGAIGDPTYIAADNSYAMGNSNNITATGARSFAIGNNNTISGSDTFVLGSNVNTNASNAVVLGNNSVGEDGAVSVGSVGNERQIKHVAPGTDANDAATVGQVAALAQNTTTVINRVDSKLNKVGAGAAALAALHPLDTDDKFTMGMGYGNYRNSHAAAIGMFYRPTDKVMISMSGTMGNGENMFNAGISFALDKGKGFSTSKAAMARKIAAQEEKISEQDAKIQSLAAENAKLAERLAAIEAKLSK